MCVCVLFKILTTVVSTPGPFNKIPDRYAQVEWNRLHVGLDGIRILNWILKRKNVWYVGWTCFKCSRFGPSGPLL